jgi:hypothetical protein
VRDREQGEGRKVARLSVHFANNTTHDGTYVLYETGYILMQINKAFFSRRSCMAVIFFYFSSLPPFRLGQCIQLVICHAEWEMGGEKVYERSWYTAVFCNRGDDRKAGLK